MPPTDRLPSPEEFHEWLVKLAMDATNFDGDCEIGAISKTEFKRALRERMAQASQVYALAMNPPAPR